MKKVLSVGLAAMIISTNAIVAVQAETITDVYADLYGVRVQFGSNVSETEIGNLSLECDNIAVSATHSISGNVVTITPEDTLELEKVYTLKIADTEKSFRIKTLFFENFDSEENAVLDGEKIIGNAFGESKLFLGSGEGFIKDGTLAFTDSVFTVLPDFEDVIDEKEVNNLTFSADIKGYCKKSLNNKGTIINANVGLAQVLMNMNGSTADSANDSYTLKLGNGNINLGKTDSTGKYTSSGTMKYTSNQGKYGYSVLTNEGVELGNDFTYETESMQRNIAMRNVGGDVASIVDGEEYLSLNDANANKGFCSISADARTLAQIDNVRITYCTQRLKEPEEGEVKALSIDGDYDKLSVKFDRSLDGANDFSKVKVYADETSVDATFALNKDDDTILEIVPENYRAGVEYRIDIEKGFGTKFMQTAEGYTFTKTIEPLAIEVVNAELSLDGFLLEMNTNMSFVNDFSAIKVLENDVEITSHTSANGNTLVIVPSSLTLGNKYKVIIPEAFGDQNRYFKNEYAYEETLTKSDLNIEKISGGDGTLKIIFDDDISSVTDFSKIQVLRNSEPVAIESKAEKNVLNIKIADFTSDTEYDLLIERGLETSEKILNKNVLKAFSLDTVAKEDFEDDDIASGINASGQIVETEDGNHAQAMWKGTVYVSTPQAVAAEDVVFSYDMRYYTACFNTIGKKYNDVIPYTLLGYNLDSMGLVNGYRVYVQPAQCVLQELNNKNETNILISKYDNWVFGDAYLDEENSEFHFYETGDSFDAVPKSKLDEVGATVSQRDCPPTYRMKWVKNGADINIYRDDDLILSSQLADPKRTTGYLGINPASTEIMMIDNIEVKVFNIKDKTELDCVGMTASETGEKVSGSFKIKNYDSSDKPLKAVVAVYGDNDKMQKAKIFDFSEIEAGEIKNVDFEINDVSGVKKISLFMLDTTDFLNGGTMPNDIIRYGCYDFPNE